jgi:flagellar L-ring protein precursor FlgH
VIPGFARAMAHRLLPPLLSLLALAAAGCSSLYGTPPTAVHQPMSVRPEPRMAVAPPNGAIYQAAYARPLFEDRRARMPGDILTINLAEKTNAQKSSNASASRGADLSAGISALGKVPLAGLAALNVAGNNESDFAGKGAAAANNLFTGTISVTVIEVYPNGNLLVSGEKQIAINQGQEFIRFSGVVNPITISTANSVQSTQVADARIEYKGSGYMDEAQTMGWLMRFFLTVLPI